MNNEKKQTELTDEQMEKVNGGMKIVVTKSPKFFSPLLRLIYKIKGSQNEAEIAKPNGNTDDINGSDDNIDGVGPIVITR